MTSIVYNKGLIIADSQRVSYTSGEFLKTGKVHAFDKPIKKYSKELGIEDHFVGFSGTGNDEIIEYAGNALLGELTLDAWKESYRYVDQLRFLHSQSGGTIMVFGTRGILLLHLVSGDINMKYHLYAEYRSISIGSGESAFKRLNQLLGESACPVRITYGTFVMEPTCGGSVEVWALPTAVRGKGALLRHVATHPELKLPALFKQMATPNKLYHPKEIEAWHSFQKIPLPDGWPKPSKEKTSPKSLASPD